MKKVILTFCAVFVAVMSFAQSIITNSNYNLSFYKAYLEVQIVKKASLANGKISNEMLDYICKKANPANVKYALINALGCNGKMLDNDIEEFNNKTIKTYFDTNYGSDMTFDDIIKVLGTSTAMSIALIHAYIGHVDAALKYAESVYCNENSRGTVYQSDYIMYKIIDIEYSRRYVGDVTTMGGLDAVKDILSMCQNVGDGEGLVHDMRKGALNTIYNCYKGFDMEIGKIKIISKSSNPYQISINGKVIGTMDGYETYEYQCSPGYYHIKAVQVSGYAFSPTVNNRDVNIEDGETATITIGYED